VLPIVSNEVIRPKDRLILYFTASSLPSSPIDPPVCTWSYPFTGHRSTNMYMCANTPAFSPLSLFGNAFTTSSFSSQSMSSPRNPCDVIPRINVYYLYALYA